jgi:hypothetical protein
MCHMCHVICSKRCYSHVFRKHHQSNLAVFVAHHSLESSSVTFFEKTNFFSICFSISIFFFHCWQFTFHLILTVDFSFRLVIRFFFFFFFLLDYVGEERWQRRQRCSQGCCCPQGKERRAEGRRVPHSHSQDDQQQAFESQTDGALCSCFLKSFCSIFSIA